MTEISMSMCISKEDRFLKQQLATLEATYDAIVDDIEEHKAVIDRLKGRLDVVGKEIAAVRRQLGMDDQS